MTQVALAEELTRRGYPTAQPTISRWLSGRRPMRRATEIVLRAMLEAIQAEAEAYWLASHCGTGCAWPVPGTAWKYRTVPGAGASRRSSNSL